MYATDCLHPFCAYIYIPNYFVGFILGVILIKLFTTFDLLTTPFKKQALAKFIYFFVITPYHKNNNLFKTNLARVSLKCKHKPSIFFIKLAQNTINFTRAIKFPKYLIWRPLIKKISYYGLYIHSRANFIKMFRG